MKFDPEKQKLSCVGAEVSAGIESFTPVMATDTSRTEILFDKRNPLVDDEREVEVDNKILEEMEERKKLMFDSKPVLDNDIHLSSGGGKAEEIFDFVQRPKVEARKITQILATVAVSFGAYIYGTSIVFPAVANPSLIQSNSSNINASSDGVAYIPFVIYEQQLSLLASVPSFGMLLGSLVAGPMANLMGRKLIYLLGVCGSLTAGYALIAGAQYAWMMILGRFLHGAGVGFAQTVAAIYTMEIATPDLRGRLAVIPAIAGTLGILSCQILGSVANWQFLSIICGCFNIPFLIVAILFIPESPVYLISRGQFERAHQVLRVLRGPSWNVTEELTAIKLAAEGSTKPSVSLRDFTVTSVLKPFLIALALMFFFQFTGINVILLYTPDIFQMAKSSIDAFHATIFVGVALLISNAITLVVADRMKRRLMLLLSAFGISSTLVGFGVFLHLKDLERMACGDGEIDNSYPVAQKLLTTTISAIADDVVSTPKYRPEPTGITPCEEIYTKNLGWLPLLLTMIYIFCFNLGYGAMIWMTIAEILPQHVRSVATSLAVGFTCLCSFLTSYTYSHLKRTITGQGVFWLYGTISFFGLLFIFIFVPETKGKTDAEIQAHFQKKSSSDNPRRIQRGVTSPRGFYSTSSPAEPTVIHRRFSSQSREAV